MEIFDFQAFQASLENSEFKYLLAEPIKPRAKANGYIGIYKTFLNSLYIIVWFHGTWERN